MVIYKSLLAMAIMCIPFIASIGSPGALGGMGTHLAFYPVLMAMFIFAVEKMMFGARFGIPLNKSFICLGLFICWIIISGMINLPNLISLEYKGANGFSRYIIQTGSFLIYVCFFMVLIGIVKRLNNQIDFLEKYLLYSFIIAGMYSVLELLLVVDFNTISGIISNVNSFRLSASEKLYLGRIRSVASESSYFGMYVGMIIPWLVVRWFSSKKNKLFWGIANIYLLLLTLLSFSRTSYFIVAIELCLMVWLFREDVKRNCKYIIVVIIALSIGTAYITSQMEDTFKFDIIGTFTSFLDDSEDNLHKVSDLTRFGSQSAAVEIFKDNPLFGVGYGAFGFYASDYYPQEAWSSEEVRVLGTNSIGTAWPPVHGIYVRILAELGLPGLIFWGGFLGFAIRELYKISQKIVDEKENRHIKAIIVSLIGCILSGFNVDAFAVMGLWIFMAFGWNIVQQNKGM